MNEFYSISASWDCSGRPARDTIAIPWAPLSITWCNVALCTSCKSTDLVLPRFWKTILPSSPICYIPVPTEDVEPLREVFSKLRFNSDVALIVNSISISQMKSDTRYLTAEDGKSGIVFRHSFTPGAIHVAEWIQTMIEESSAKCELWQFMYGITPNVNIPMMIISRVLTSLWPLCRSVRIIRLFAVIRESSSVAVTTVTVHSGARGRLVAMTTSILVISRVIAEKHLKFHTNVELIAFGGEEQGRPGSIVYAREYSLADHLRAWKPQHWLGKLRDEGQKCSSCSGWHAGLSEEPLQLGLPETWVLLSSLRMFMHPNYCFSGLVHQKLHNW